MLGHSLFGPMDVACAWAREHLHQVDAARAAAASARQATSSDR
ncbi:hypothetical protein [Kitasatospora kifunensis]|uniref:DNA-binding HxlR family transcriptional regulator n=1 Tax=Kitasatospora kifunensis TaxID=58351 RepID=A0A7W7R4V3_KITKI|nr:hypothetical protein [Kitasatospora kifunensis]MBB4925492.1 DNA-binding HxlR family transcriptional regulator [Kitasatospora kifunensis]